MQKQYTERQISQILHEAESGIGIRDLCQNHDVYEQKLYRWRRK